MIKLNFLCRCYAFSKDDSQLSGWVPCPTCVKGTNSTSSTISTGNSRSSGRYDGGHTMLGQLFFPSATVPHPRPPTDERHSFQRRSSPSRAPLPLSIISLSLYSHREQLSARVTWLLATCSSCETFKLSARQFHIATMNLVLPTFYSPGPLHPTPGLQIPSPQRRAILRMILHNPIQWPFTHEASTRSYH